MGALDGNAYKIKAAKAASKGDFEEWERNNRLYLEWQKKQKSNSKKK